MATNCEFRDFSMGEMWDETYQLCCASTAGSDKMPIVPSDSVPATVSDKPPQDKQQFNGIYTLYLPNFCYNFHIYSFVYTLSKQQKAKQLKYIRMELI